MRLTECGRGARVRVGSIHTGEALVQRLRALGLFAGEYAEVLRISPRRKVWYLATACSIFAVGAEIPAQVEVFV